ncbi:hypothetical protein [Absidia glauca]|uniref:Uncharacterized protein n=1 Tax=Absidia glauca TaxID=4829 RepID=A0A163IUA8_ABSGL|nr:hypothetical protein [Absidia glauca]
MNNNDWALTRRQDRIALGERFAGGLKQLEDQAFEEKRWHWARLHTLREEVVPHIMNVAHQDLAGSNDYRADLRRLMRRLVPSPTLRRMIYTRLIHDDPWYLSGGPDLPGLEDVVAPVLEAGLEKFSPGETDLFSSLLGVNGLFDWAMEPPVSSLGQ